MKTTLILLAIALTGCVRPPLEQHNKVALVVNRATQDVPLNEYEFKGHRYLALESKALLHAEHCPCKEPYATSAKLNNAFLNSMLGTNAP